MTSIPPSTDDDWDRAYSATAGQRFRSFTLPSGRTLTVSIDGDVFMLDRTERKFVMGLLDSIEEYLDFA